MLSRRRYCQWAPALVGGILISSPARAYQTSLPHFYRLLGQVLPHRQSADAISVAAPRSEVWLTQMLQPLICDWHSLCARHATAMNELDTLRRLVRGHIANDFANAHTATVDGCVLANTELAICVHAGSAARLT